MKIEIGNLCIVVNPGPVPEMETNRGALVKVDSIYEGMFSCEVLSSVQARRVDTGQIMTFMPGPDTPFVTFDAYQLYPLAPTPDAWQRMDETLEWAGYPPNIKIAHSIGKTRLSNEALRRIEQDIAQENAIERMHTSMDRLMGDPRFGKFIKPRPRLS